ncbi:hypothetical protein Patl1_19130 [Pistacia atlantica]|uniref:Uncharacterized protein n=1 Tax=Pistacia atlantica TaxID=434234 RepID=A0ACC1C1W6_9ROSI|nr:hypothetical protein Patl1_19130 [Pistacia atlantica]
MEENLPPGFRFHPTDEELITYYLTRKVSDVSFTSKAIVDVDLNKCEPWDLPGKASMGEKEWYFFNMRDRKYPTGLRTNRATVAGYWKTTGKDKEIFRGFSKRVIHQQVKKPQQEQSSQPSLGSPCDTNSMVNEFGDIDQLPNLNTMANLSSGFNSNIPTQSYNTDNNLNMNIHNLNMNWAAAREAATTLPSLAWPSSLLSPNLSMNSLLLKALQLRSTYNQAREATSSDHNSLIQPLPQGISRFECDHLNSNFQASSSSKVLDNSLPQQSQPEQPFNLDSIW